MLRKPHRSRSTRSRRQRGFTAIEVLIGMSVALISLAGVLAMYVIAARGNDIAFQQSTATSMARTTIEELRARAIDDLAGEFGGGGLPFYDVEYAIIEERGVDYTVLLTLEEVAGDAEMIRVRVRVVWTEQGAAEGDGVDHEIRLETLRNRTDIL